MELLAEPARPGAGGAAPEVAAPLAELAVPAGYCVSDCLEAAALAAVPACCKGSSEVAAWAMVLLLDLGALACCWNDGPEVVARAVELLVELAVPACCEKGGPQVVSRAVELLAEPAAPAA